MQWFHNSRSKFRAHAAGAIALAAVTVLAQAAMAATSVPIEVMSAIQAGNAQDVIVLFNSKKAARDVNMLRTISGQESDIDISEILEFKAEQYRWLKARALRVIGTLGITERYDYSHLPMAFLRVENLAALQRLVNSPYVAGVYANSAHQHALIESLPLIGQPSAQSLAKTGVGTTIAVLDTGVNYTLAEFGSCSSPGVPAGCRVPVALDFAPNDNLLDDTGHGTNVAAIVAAVAPGTRIAALDIYNGGYAFTADVLAAINWSIANKTTYNIVALNLSLGDGSNNAVECPGSWATLAFADARAAGILPVVAAGNNGYANGISGPACAPGAVRVGAVYDSNIGAIGWPGLCTDYVTAADRVTCFSNSADILTLLAPGSIINAGGYSNSGTSQAAPFVAGAVAVLRAADAFPAETLDQTVARMQNTGDLLSDPKNSRITARLNLGRAVLP